MTVSDAGFLYLERPHAALNIGVVALLDGPLPHEALVARLREQVAAHPRYAQRPVASLLGAAHPHWELVPRFDPARHLKRAALPQRAGEPELLALAARLIATPLDRRQPLWRIHQIETGDGLSALVHSVHHCMIDGVSGAFLLDRLLDPDESAAGAVDAPARTDTDLRQPPRGWARRLADELGAATGRPLRFGRELAQALQSPARARAATEWLLARSFDAVQLGTRDIPRMRWNAPLVGPRRLESLRLPQSAIRRIRLACGGSPNDVLLAVIAGGLHRYLESTGTSTRDLELSALVPVSLRSPDEAASLGNQLSAMLVPLATDLEREPARLLVTQRITGQLKAGAAWTRIESLLALLEHAPPWLLRLGARSLPLARLAHLIATHVPGPRVPRRLLGRRVSALHPVVPIADGIGLGIAALSYADHLQVSLHADAQLVPDLEKLRFGMEEAFAGLIPPG